jgi:GMP synthase (glutamine-hydrolysing)
MKPVLILQHLDNDDPAYLATWLSAHGVDFEVRNSERGEAFPASIAGWSALAILGGAMSANDPLPSLRRAELLIREAVTLGRPVLGHCLGGQLMARALGGEVFASPAPEIGWQRVDFDPLPAAQDWFGDLASARLMHWHYEAFSLPPGAQRIATSAACANQAFALGPHLAMQFHIEVDATKVDRWSREHEPAWIAAQGRVVTVQDGAAMRADIDHFMTAHQVLADRIYSRWLALAGHGSC